MANRSARHRAKLKARFQKSVLRRRGHLKVRRSGGRMKRIGLKRD